MNLPKAMKDAPCPLAIIVDPDGIGATKSVQHLLRLGFGHILHLAHVALPDLDAKPNQSGTTDSATSPAQNDINHSTQTPTGSTRGDDNAARSVPMALTAANYTRIPFLAQTQQDLARALSQVFRHLKDKWVYWGFAGETLHFAHDDRRKIQDYLAFLDEERHPAAPSLTVDLYPKLLNDCVLDPENSWFDSAGYYCNAEHQKTRQCFGGLRHRFEAHLPEEMQILNRPRLFRVGRIDWDDELGTPPPYRSATDVPPSCCILSWRAAIALQTLPSAQREIKQLHWPQSQKWRGDWRDLPPLGLLHHGKWF